MITIENVIISYKRNIKIINSLSLRLQDNTINGIVGLNGSGKTTLLNAIYGIKKIDSGRINYNDEKLLKSHVSYLVTESFFYSNITAREYLSLFKNPDFDLEKWNKLFALPIDDIIDTYSTGMKKKLALLGVLKQDKPLMILDEPFNGLDFETSRLVRSILLKLKDLGKTIIITSHIIETLTNLCDYIHYLKDGKIKSGIEKKDFSKLEKEMFELIENKNEKILGELLTK